MDAKRAHWKGGPLSYIADQGDIILLDFDPSAGMEIQKRRPALVLSKKAFNQTTGFSIASPITITVRGLGCRGCSALNTQNSFGKSLGNIPALIID